MKTLTAPEQLIDVDALRVGMFIHLDLGWMSHPFPLSSFRISNEEQLATVRRLGLKQVRWRPGESEPPVPLAPRVAAPVRSSGEAADTATSPSPSVAAQVVSIADATDALARQAHRRALAAQRAALETCERQHAEAARDFQSLTRRITDRPEAARADAEQLVRALTTKLIDADEVRIRLLPETTADRDSAHALNVAVISLLMGRTFGLADAEMQDLGVGALLHDIGRLELPERVREFDEHFSAAELRCHEQHVAHGIRQARRMGLSPGATLAIAQHHEKSDGSGYPLGLNVDRMGLAARIVALVDRYDQLCNPRDPARALTPHEAVSLLFAQGRGSADTAILGAFIKMMGVYPAGSTVQLTDDRYAIVVSVNSTRPLKPRVLVHAAGVPRREALILDLETTEGLGIRRSVKPLLMPSASIAYLEPRPGIACFFEPVGEPSRAAVSRASDVEAAALAIA